MYFKKTNKKGQVMFYEDNHLVAKKDIPDGEPVIDRDFELPVESQAQKLARTIGGDVELETIDGDSPQTGTVNEDVTPSLPTIPAEITIPKECAVCGKEGEFVRYFDGRTFYLCEAHYALNLGKLAQALREHGKRN